MGPPSVSSGGAGSDVGSEASSGGTLGLGLLARDAGDAGDAGDLLRGNATSKKEALFAALHFIYKDRWLPTEWRYVLLAALLQWAQMLIIFFGPTLGWDIDWHGNSFWRFYMRLQLQYPITQQGWRTYTYCLYGGSALVLGMLAAVLWLHFALKSRTKFKWQWPFHILRILICLSMTTFQTSYLLVFTVGFDCNSESANRSMYYFPTRNCFSMPSTAIFGFSIFMALVFEVMSLIFALLEMGALDWTSGNYFSLSAGKFFFMRRIIKFSLPLVHVALKFSPRWMGWFHLLLATWFLYITVRRVPMHRLVFNLADAGLYSMCWWAAGLGLLGIYYPRYWPALTSTFLYGALPVAAACTVLAYWRLHHIWRVAALFTHWTPATPRNETHRFKDEYEVEVVNRVCQAREKSPTLEWVPVATWVNCAENVLRAGLIQFPDSAYLCVLMGTFSAVLREEASGGLAFLQRARKCSDMGITERFQVYVREQEKLAQKGREGDAMAIMDASSWAEHNANYKQVVKCHKDALLAQKGFWQALTHQDVSMRRLVSHFAAIEKTRVAAERAYKTVMERYPNNPRIMRAYSKFLGQVKNDPHGSARYAASATRVEEAQAEKRRETMYAQIMERDYEDEDAGRMLTMTDDSLDAVCLINSEGRIQYTNAAFGRLFGYKKGEVEGSNVSSLMPAPFSQQHDGYLQNYMTTRQPRILDRVREVVALHRLHHVFPVHLCVTPITMSGQECFMGVIKPQEDDPGSATIYATASGQIVCVSRGFTNSLAYTPTDVMGVTFQSLCTNTERAAQLLAALSSAAMTEVMDFGQLTVLHRFGEEVQVSVSGRRAGSESVRVMVLKLQSSGRYTGLLCVNPSTERVTFANQSFADMLKMPTDQIIKMRLHELMPEPYNQLHQRWLKGRDVSRCTAMRCRSGRVVEFKNKTGKLVPALLEITEQVTETGMQFLVRVAAVKRESAETEWNRLTLVADAAGVVTATAGRAALFGLDSEALVGQSLDSLLDIFRRSDQEEQVPAGTILGELVGLARDGRANAHRIALSVRGKRMQAAVMQVVPGADGDGLQTTTLHVYRTDALEGVLELDSRCKIKRCNDEGALLLGRPAAAVIGCELQVFLPHVAPGRHTTELMAAPGQRGGSKRSIGPVISTEAAAHPDGNSMHVALQVAESIDRPGRYIMRLTCPRGVSSASSIGRPPTSTTEARPATGAPLGCPFHRAMASGSGASLLGRLGLGGGRGPSPPPGIAAAAEEAQPRGSCPFNPNTEDVLASLSFPAGSQFAAPGAAREAAAVAVAEMVGGKQGRAEMQDLAARSGTGQGAGQEQTQEGAEGQIDGSVSYNNTMSISAEEGGSANEEEAGDDGLNPQELAAKRQLVADWLQHAGGDAPGGAAGGSVSGGADGVLLQLDRPISASPERALMATGSQSQQERPLKRDEVTGVRVDKPPSTTDDMSSLGGSEGTTLADEEGDDAAADLSRLKRYRKANKLLSSTRSRRAVNTLQAQLKWVLLTLVVVHTGFFAGSISLINSSVSYIQQVDMAGTAARNAISMCADARAIQWAGMEIAQYGAPVTYPYPNVTAATMLGKVAKMEANLERLYFLPGKDADRTRNYFHDTLLNVTTRFGTQPPEASTEVLDLWAASEDAINCFKDVASLPVDFLFRMDEYPQFQKIMNNVPDIVSPALNRLADVQTDTAVQRLQNITLATFGFLGAEAALVIPLCALYLYFLLRAVAHERFSLFSTFLFIPRAAVLALARAEVHVDDLDDAGSDDEDAPVAQDGGGTSMQLSKAPTSSARTQAQIAAQDRMAITKHAIAWLMMPFGVWLVVCVITWSMQYQWIRSSKERVMALDAAERIYVYQARVKFYALELAAEGTLTHTDTPSTLHLRAMLADAAARLRYWHEVVLYGSNNPLRPVHNEYNLAGFEFMPTIFTSPERWQLMFRPGCLRTNQSTCPTPADDIYWTTQFGLAILIQHFAQQAEVLAADAIEAITIHHPSVKYIVPVATNDMVGGLARGNEIFMQISNFTYDRILQACVLAFLVCGTLAYLYLCLQPFCKTTWLEGKKVAEVLSFLSGIDINQLIANADIGGPAPSGGTLSRKHNSFKRSLSQSSDMQ